ncbi:penicillin-binding transpeptidase domain-containing protein [Romboutsia timonensis]|jgi:penicillin-binding protein 2|uniref:penicillin-binding transpeptidase domain-containing protein n=1 Tax=Romboutsia timonensis TaxID=1776391 RepID=UPI0008D9373A|nr:penicillin-binding transpeptidase domain-containing protein [Romboutsia timonensis]
MEERKKVDRLSIIKNLILVAFVVILVKILYMTTFKYEHYTELAENKTYKQLLIKAPRGEIKDRYGRLLAGNKNLFTVQVSGDEIKRKDSNGKSMANDICLKLINLLEKNNEEYIDEFPIYIQNGKYYYTFDKNIREYKNNNNIPQELDAKESFYYLVDQLVSEGVLTQDDRKLEVSKLQKKLNENGYYPPILVSKWLFTEQKNKQDWLESYGIEDSKITAKKAFYEIRNNKNYKIDKNLSDSDARKILVVRDLIKSQGYSQYNPITIATDISQKTISQLEESAIELPGVSVAVEPVRYYPNTTLASHILGHMGKMPSGQEDKYLNREEGKTYSKGDTVGISGIEKSYEEQLRGVDGYKKVQVDALGRITRELDVSEPKSGDTVYLSIDKDLQEDTENALKGVLEALRVGGTYKSKYGNKTFSSAAKNAASGAVIAIDAKNGDVLSMASYPNYDPNKFVNGISYEDYQALQPKNKNDVLAANPQVNLATQGVFQPGSTFKMVTGMAAIDNGLSPNYAIQDTGVIRLGGPKSRPFADLIWHKSRSNHGYTDLYKAIQESCNIYFYTIGSGKNYTGGKDPSVKVGAKGIIEYAKKFGLDDYTGLNEEIDERKGSVPNMAAKLETTKTLLRDYLTKEMANDFTDISKSKNPKEYESRIEEIVSWADETKTVGRVEAMERLTKMKVKEDRVETLADSIVFSYLNFAKWSTADTFNISIGQGENQYTPAQMARYVAAIGNGGNLVELSVVDRVISNDYNNVDIDENKVEKIDFNNPEKLKDLIEGMKRVSTQGSGKGIFGPNYPISVASKTGTAEKSGKIPTENEVEYLKSHMSSYGVSLDEAVKLAEKMKKAREKELTEERINEIKEELKRKDLKEEERKSLEEELKDGVNVKLEDTDKVNASYLRKAIKELNPKITDEKIDSYKESYKSFAWAVAVAPADDPEIAVVAMIPQGESSSNAMLLIREVLGSYFDLDNNKGEKNNKNDENTGTIEKENINFVSQMKK